MFREEVCPAEHSYFWKAACFLQPSVWKLTAQTSTLDHTGDFSYWILFQVVSCLFFFFFCSSPAMTQPSMPTAALTLVVLLQVSQGTCDLTTFVVYMLSYTVFFNIDCFCLKCWNLSEIYLIKPASFPETQTFLICCHDHNQVFLVSFWCAIRLLVLMLTSLPWQPGLVKASHLVKMV